jgi:hypothetical protein
MPVIRHDVPQYAHFLPKYFPRYGTSTMVNNSSICCNDSLHSLSASETYSSSSSAEDAVGEDGRESISSASEELSGCSMKLSLLLVDMARSDEGQGSDDRAQGGRRVGDRRCSYRECIDVVN